MQLNNLFKFNFLKQPFAIIESKNEDELFKLVNRSALIRSMYELWETAKSIDQLHRQLKANPIATDPLYSAADRSFRIQIESYNRKIASNLKVQKIEQLRFLDWKGRVNLVSPDHSFHLIEFYGTANGQPSETPLRLYFGRWICDGNRKVIDDLRLSDRRFISNTSMDVTLSLIMSNLANITTNDLVLDPFVGSGSLLVAAAKHGAYVIGCDIDYLLLHGRTKPTKKGQTKRADDEGVLANLAQYDLQNRYVDVIVGDSSLPFWRSGAIFDAIITDPPYGIREASIKIGAKEMRKVPEHCLDRHVPAKISYDIDQIMEDLLMFADERVKIDGRLVYWLPLSKETYDLDDLPKHDHFTVLYHAAQKISRQSLRVLICMQKVK